AVDDDRLVPARSADRHDERLGGIVDPGYGADAGGEVAILGRASLDRRAGAAQVETDEEHTVLPEAGIEHHQVAQAAHEQQRADDEYERQRHLGDHQSATQAEALVGIGGATAAR